MAQIVRFERDSRIGYGLLVGQNVHELIGDPAGEYRSGADLGRLDELKILPPCEPTKIMGVGLNYVGTLQEIAQEPPTNPILFLKALSAIVGSMDPIVVPSGLSEVNSEGELAVVIGQRGRHIPPTDARRHILGYTCANDVTAAQLVGVDHSAVGRAKNYDTFCPLGPWVTTHIDADNLKIRSRLNGKLCQDASTAEMLFSVERVVSFVSSIMTLQPGDVILTGTPGGSGPMRPGDVVEVEIEGIGTLRNVVIADSPERTGR